MSKIGMLEVQREGLDVFNRVTDVDKLDKQLSDYNEEELAAYLLKNYGTDALWRLRWLMTYGQVGQVVGYKAKLMVEAWQDVQNKGASVRISE